jgi:glycosyltransferase involved in cell wall biosynthesis
VEQNSDIWFVIAAFNEAEVISKVVSPVIEAGYNVVVVDDHSSDDTLGEAMRAGAVAVRHPINLGQGASLETGKQLALKNGAVAVVTFDADGQHRLSDAEMMLSRLKADQVDVVLGSRFLGEKAVGISKRKTFLLKLATLYTRLSTGLNVTDSHNGLRVFSASGARQVVIRQNGMAHASEILSLISRLRLSYVEHPVQIIYSPYSRRKGQRMSNALSILFELFLGRIIR